MNSPRGELTHFISEDDLDRGLVKEGYAADLVVSDPVKVADAATYESPHQMALGVPHVIVNGEPEVQDGRPTAARPGRTLRGGK